MASIQAAFVAQLRAKVPANPCLGTPWACTEEERVPDEAATSAEPVSASDASDPIWIAQQRGWTQGETYYEKTVGSRVIWKLQKFTSTGAEFQQHNIWAPPGGVHSQDDHI